MLGFFKQVEEALHLGHKDPDSEPKEDGGEKEQEESNEPKEEDGEQEPEKAKPDGPAEQLMDFMQNIKKTKIKKKKKKGHVRGRKGLASDLLIKVEKEYADEENEEEEGNENDEEDCEDGDCAEEEEEEEEEETAVAGN